MARWDNEKTSNNAMKQSTWRFNQHNMGMGQDDHWDHISWYLSGLIHIDFRMEAMSFHMYLYLDLLQGNHQEKEHLTITDTLKIVTKYWEGGDYIPL